MQGYRLRLFVSFRSETRFMIDTARPAPGAGSSEVQTDGQAKTAGLVQQDTGTCREIGVISQRHRRRLIREIANVHLNGERSALSAYGEIPSISDESVHLEILGPVDCVAINRAATGGLRSRIVAARVSDRTIQRSQSIPVFGAAGGVKRVL